MQLQVGAAIGWARISVHAVRLRMGFVVSAQWNIKDTNAREFPPAPPPLESRRELSPLALASNPNAITTRRQCIARKIRIQIRPFGQIRRTDPENFRSSRCFWSKTGPKLAQGGPLPIHVWSAKGPCTHSSLTGKKYPLHLRDLENYPQQVAME